MRQSSIGQLKFFAQEVIGLSKEAIKEIASNLLLGTTDPQNDARKKMAKSHPGTVPPLLPRR